jgi:hypothetical protein
MKNQYNEQRKRQRCSTRPGECKNKSGCRTFPIYSARWCLIGSALIGWQYHLTARLQLWHVLVLVDTNRDWGSEIVLLKTHPLAVATVLKTGKGGIGAIAIDHRNGIVRLVGFWKQRWHDMKYDEQHPGKWTETKN